jgi:hypothetical protein
MTAQQGLALTPPSGGTAAAAAGTAAAAAGSIFGMYGQQTILASAHELSPYADYETVS